jgi:hypothetical protein
MLDGELWAGSACRTAALRNALLRVIQKFNFYTAARVCSHGSCFGRARQCLHSGGCCCSLRTCNLSRRLKLLAPSNGGGRFCAFSNSGVRQKGPHHIPVPGLHKETHRIMWCSIAQASALLLVTHSSKPTPSCLAYLLQA